MGNRYSARSDEFAWTLGAKRRLRRYLLEAGLTHSEAALLLGTTVGSVSGAADRYGLRLTPQEQRDRQGRQSYERAKHGRRGYKDRDWDSKVFETWAERKARLAKERGL